MGRDGPQDGASVISMVERNATPSGLSQDDLAALRQLAERYVQIKYIITYAEEIQVDHKADILVYKELRDAMDHLMRVLLHGLSPESPSQIESGEEYRRVNLDKSAGHMYRAAFDALDTIILSFKEHINSNLSGYSKDVVTKVLPEYFKLKIKLSKLTDRAAERRGKKDIGRITDDVFNEYVQDVSELKTLHEDVLQAGPEFDEYQKDLTKKEKKNKTQSFIQSFILVVLSVGLTLLGRWMYETYIQK